MPTPEQIKIREAERVLLTKLGTMGERGLWKGNEVLSRRCPTPDEILAFMDREYPSLSPVAEKVTLSDGSVWEYAPHYNEKLPWRSNHNNTTHHSGNPWRYIDRPSALTAADHDDCASAIRRYEARNK